MNAPTFTPTRPCTCGSGKQRFAIYDAAGIFCTYACPKCEKEKKSHYNPAIFEDGTAYANSGEEDHIGWERDSDYSQDY